MPPSVSPARTEGRITPPPSEPFRPLCTSASKIIWRKSEPSFEITTLACPFFSWQAEEGALPAVFAEKSLFKGGLQRLADGGDSALRSGPGHKPFRSLLRVNGHYLFR